MKRRLKEAARTQGEEEEEEEEEEFPEIQKKSKVILSEKDQEILEERQERETAKANVVPYRNKQRVLVFSSRGVTSRYRHLMEDLRTLLPHHRKEVKHDSKKNLYEINQIAELKACNSTIFFEVRKKKDLFLWITRVSDGPSCKFLISNVHTMDELQMTGNCLKGSRPILSFGKEFDAEPHWQLVKEMLTQTFGTPKGHPKSKPFVDHVLHFALVDGRIWFRNYQITDSTHDRKERARLEKLGTEVTQLVEVGPRMVMTLVKIFDGGFGGKPLYENADYVSPNTLRAEYNAERGQKYASRKQQEQERQERQTERVLPKNEYKQVFQ